MAWEDRTPFDAIDFRRRWDIMMAWKAYRHLQDPTDPLLDKWEIEKRLEMDPILRLQFMFMIPNLVHILVGMVAQDH